MISVKLIENWQCNIIPIVTQTTNKLRNASRKSMKPIRCSAIHKNAPIMIGLEAIIRTGNDAVLQVILIGANMRGSLVAYELNMAISMTYLAARGASRISFGHFSAEEPKALERVLARAHVRKDISKSF